uniref:S1 motif domain-containing protein n=1 Tax=Panagrolaimus sp. ES5 TaxID=591445 RepID=A0AC34F3A5_9BILA
MDVDVKAEIKDEVQDISEEINQLPQPTSSSQTNSSQNGINGQEPKYSDIREEPMEQEPTPTEEIVRPLTPPIRERTRSRSRTRERSEELQGGFAAIVKDEIEAKISDKTKPGDDTYKHYVCSINDFKPPQLSLSASLRISKQFGYKKYALEAFECGHHVFFSSDDFQDRKAISDYVRRKTITEYHAETCVYIIARNESIAQERYRELAVLISSVFLMPYDIDLQRLQNMPSSHQCYVSTIETFRTFYLQFPGHFKKDDVFIFEDFQYFGSPDVGHFYEEALVVPPVCGQFVFLTSNIANADELSKWICKNDKDFRPVECITVLKRSFTLNHFITRQYESEMGQVVDKDGKFRKTQFVEATKVTDKSAKSDVKKTGIGRQPQIVKLVRTVLFRVQPPILIYSFDTEDIENTVNLLNTFNLNSEQEQFVIDKMYSSEMKRLSKDDAMLKEVQHLLPFLQRGIAPYHYGMFPFLRKIVEVFFARGLIKILVADNSLLMETNLQFQAGIILRDRCMIELGYYRWIKPNEYKAICERIQGKTLSETQTPLVILVNGDEDMPIDVAKEIFTNNIPSIESQLQITASLILSVMQSPILSENTVIEKSFARFNKIQQAKKIEFELREKDRELKDFPIDEGENLERYQGIKDRIEDLKAALQTHKFVYNKDKLFEFMDVGRIVKARINQHDFGYCIVVDRSGTNSVDVILNVTKESYEAEDDNVLRPAEIGLKNKMVVCRAKLVDVTVVTQHRLALPRSLCTDEECDLVLQLLKTHVENLMGEVPELEIEHLGMTDSQTKAKVEEIKLFEKELEDLKDRIPNFHHNYERFQEKQKLLKAVEDLENLYEIAQCNDEKKMQENHLKMLGQHDYFDDKKENIKSKAEFALNLPVKENILLTELFFEESTSEKKALFTNLSLKETLFILSTFINMEITLEEIHLPPEFRNIFDDFTNNRVQKYGSYLRRYDIIKMKQVLPYIQSFNATLCDFIDLWCKKMPFNSAMAHTNIRSGFVATYLGRLHELLVRIKAKSHLIPPYPKEEENWTKRFQELDALIARDIPFCTV